MINVYIHIDIPDAIIIYKPLIKNAPVPKEWIKIESSENFDYIKSYLKEKFNVNLTRFDFKNNEECIGYTIIDKKYLNYLKRLRLRLIWK